MMRVTQTGRRERRAGRRGKEEYGEPCLEKGQLLLSREPDWAGHWIYADKCNQRLLASETPNVTDLRHELRTCRFTDAIHGHDGVKFRQLAGKAQHPGTNGLNSSGNCEKLCGSFLYQQLRGSRSCLRGGDNFSGTCVDLRSLVRIEVVAVTLAPLAVALDKGCTTDGGDAFGVPEGCNKVHPFLTAVFASGTVEPAIHSRKGLIQQCDEIIGQRYSRFGVQVKLPVQGF